MYRPLPKRIISPIQRQQLRPVKQQTEDAIMPIIKIGEILKDIQKSKDTFQAWLDTKMIEVESTVKEVQRIQKGERGERGFTGIKGEKGERGERGEQGIKGEKGDVGETPVAGFDFPLPKDGMDGKDADPEAVIEKIKSLPKGRRLKIEHIDGLQPTLDAFSRQIGEHNFGGMVRGGGDTVQAGTGISIVRNASTGKSVITATGGSSTFYTETPTGVIDSANVTFTVLHAINTVFSFAINGQYLHPTTDYTFTGTTITMVTALPSSLSGKPFTIVYV